MKAANLLLRFLLELAALAAVSYWGYHVAEGEAGRLALCIAAPILFAILWGLFAAHKGLRHAADARARTARAVRPAKQEASRGGGAATPLLRYFPLPKPWKSIVGFLLLEAAALSLALAGQLVWAGVFAVVIAGNTAVLEFFFPGAQEDLTSR